MSWTTIFYSDVCDGNVYSVNRYWLEHPFRHLLFTLRLDRTFVLNVLIVWTCTQQTVYMPTTQVCIYTRFFIFTNRYQSALTQFHKGWHGTCDGLSASSRSTENDFYRFDLYIILYALLKGNNHFIFWKVLTE